MDHNLVKDFSSLLNEFIALCKKNFCMSINFSIDYFLLNTSPINFDIIWPLELKLYLLFYLKIYCVDKNFPLPFFCSFPKMLNMESSPNVYFLLSSFGLDSNFSLLDFLNEKKDNFDLLILGYVKNLNKCEYPREIQVYKKIKNLYKDNKKIIVKGVRYKGSSMMKLASADNITFIQSKDKSLSPPKEPLGKLHHCLMLFKSTFIQYKVSHIIISTSGEPDNPREKHFSDISTSIILFEPYLSVFVGIKFNIIVKGINISREDKIRLVYSHSDFNLLTRSCVMRNEYFLRKQSNYFIYDAYYPHLCGTCKKCVEDIIMLEKLFNNVFMNVDAEKEWRRIFVKGKYSKILFIYLFFLSFFSFSFFINFDR